MILGKSVREVEQFDMDEIYGWICFDIQYALPNSWQESASIMSVMTGLHSNKQIPARKFMPVKEFQDTEDEIEAKVKALASIFK